VIKIVNKIKQFVDEFNYSLLNIKNQSGNMMKVIEDQNFQDFLKIITKTDTYSENIANEFQKEDAITGLSNIKILKSALYQKTKYCRSKNSRFSIKVKSEIRLF
jgi:glutamine synthetase type III